MREQRFFHARNEHHVELQAFRRVHRHKRDGRIVFSHRIQIGAQANPLNKVGQRIGRKLAHACEVLAFGQLGLFFLRILVGLHIFLDNRQELLDVLDAPARFVSVLVFERGNEARFLDNRLDYFAQIAAVAAALLDKRDEAAKRRAGAHLQVLVSHAQLSRQHERHIRHGCRLVDIIDGSFADASARRVDDALGRNVVVGVHEQREVCHNVANFGAIEESRAADDLVGNTSTQHHVFERARLSVRAVEHSHLVIREAFGSALVDFTSNPTALVALIRCHVHVNLVAIGLGSAQRFVFAMLVMAHHGICRVQNIAR